MSTECFVLGGRAGAVLPAPCVTSLQMLQLPFPGYNVHIFEDIFRK